MACDAPLALPPAPTHVAQVKASKKPWAALSLGIATAVSVSVLGLHHLAERGRLNLEQMQAIKPIYSIAGMAIPLYRDVDGLRLEKTSMRLEEHQFRMEMQLSNSTAIPTRWPAIRLTLLDAAGTIVHTDSKNANDLAKQPSPFIPPNFASPIYWNVPQHLAPTAVNYRLEVQPFAEHS